MKFFKILFFLFGVFIAVNIHAQSSDELRRRRERETQELERLNREYEGISKNKKTTLKQLSLLRAQINLREEKINGINSEIRNLDSQISENTNTVHSLQNQLTQLKKEYAAMILFAYHNQSSYNKLMFIFAAKDFNQSYRRLKYLQQFGTYRERQAHYIEGTEKDLHVKINQLDNTKKEKKTILVDQVKEKMTLGKQKKDEVKVIATLSKQQGQLLQQQKELQRKIARTNQEISAAIRREIAEARRRAEEEAARAAKTGNVGNKGGVNARKPITKNSTTSEVLNATPEAAKLSSDFLGNKGRLPWPVTNGVPIQEFGRHTEQGIVSENNGIDIKTNENAPVRAVFEGKVKTVRNVYGTLIVIIVHGEYFTVYSNLKSVNVSVGQKVSTMQNIGVAGVETTTGITQIGFQLYKGGSAINPKPWLASE